LIINDPIIKMHDFDYVETDKCPTKFNNFLDFCANNEEKTRIMLNQCLGDLMTPENKRQLAYIFYGPTAGNGKTALCRILSGAMHPKTTWKNLGEILSGSFGLAGLETSFVNFCDEAKVRENGAGRLLTITGGAPVEINQKNKPAYEARVRSHFVIATNYLFSSGDSKGMNRRLKVIPFYNSIKNLPYVDHELSDKIIAKEGRELILWCFYQAKLIKDVNVLEESKEAETLRGEMTEADDSVSSWFWESYKFDIKNDEKRYFKPMYERYVSWCRNNNQQPYSKRRHGMTMRSIEVEAANNKIDFKRQRDENGFYYLGLSINPTTPDFLENNEF
jgi:phage/plasmid-associated DNA primase